jgi:HrpA-like RNA helicase
MIIHKHEAHGDILSFLTGQDEVEQACAMLKDAAKTLVKTDYDKLWVLPMYGALPAKDQFKVFDSAPAGTRKVIVATNIAEASVTIPGVAYGKSLRFAYAEQLVFFSYRQWIRQAACPQ